jgi:hypothetical protein
MLQDDDISDGSTQGYLNEGVAHIKTGIQLLRKAKVDPCSYLVDAFKLRALVPKQEERIAQVRSARANSETH